MKKVIAIILSVALVFGLCSCGSPAPSEIANDFMKAIKEKDNETLKTVYAGGSLDITESVKEGEGGDEFDKLFGDALYEKLFAFEYEVSNEKIDGDKATVDVAIKTYGLGSAFTNFVSEYMAQAFTMALSGSSEEAIEKKALEILSAKIEETKMDYEKTVSLSLSKKEDQWVVDEVAEDSDFYNAITGGMLEATKNIENSFNPDGN